MQFRRHITEGIQNSRKCNWSEHGEKKKKFFNLEKQ